MSNKRYTEDHEWVAIEGDTATVGISEYAQAQLGDVVFVELPEVGATIEKGKEFAVVESVKAASEIYAPVSGEVVDVNAALEDKPDMINESAEDTGWLAKITPRNAAEADSLMDAEAYAAFVEGLDD